MKTSDLHFTLNDWEKRQRHYWKPVLYFKRKNDRHHGVDFCMAAKNACSSMKMFMTWIEDKNYKTSDRHKELTKNWFIQHDKDWTEEDEVIYQQYAFDGHFRTRRITRVKLWQNQDTDMTTFFRDEALKKFCIKRDPIQRFLSGYIHTHKNTGPAWHGLHDYSIDGFIDRIRDGEYWYESVLEPFLLKELEGIEEKIIKITKTQNPKYPKLIANMSMITDYEIETTSIWLTSIQEL